MNEPVRPASDLSQDPLRLTRRNPLDSMFAPRSVAVVGASERPDSVGRTLLWNLVSNPFGGVVYPVNPKRQSVLGIRAYPSVAALPEPPELAIIATRAPTVPARARECAAAGARALIIVSSGFKEVGPEGVRLEQELLQIAREARIRVLGPNCLGVMRPHRGLNATFARGMARPGSVAMVSQSGALLASVLDWSLREGVGFSCFASVGSMLDVSFGDLIDYLGNDARTRSILLYMETIGDARAFLSAAREVALNKPIIVAKAGRTQEAARAAASHTGSLTGSDEVLSAAFRRAGVLRVDTIADLFHMAETLAHQPRPAGKRLTIVSNAGGPAVLATDSLVYNGGALAPLSAQTRAGLEAFLPPEWSHANPVDIRGDADPERYARAVEVAGADPDSDGLLVILTPQDMTDPTRTAERLKEEAQKLGRKPVLASWMGGEAVSAGVQLLNQAGIPTFGYPDTAARIFTYMWRYTTSLRALYETPVLAEAPEEARRREESRALVEGARSSGRTQLTEAESKRLLAAYGIPVVDTRVATSAEAAVEEAGRLGYPVVLKLLSTRIMHKSDVGGVCLDLRDAAAVRDAFEGIRRRLEARAQADAFEGVTVQPMVKLEGYELIVGSSVDPQFGPVMLFGTGGTLVEVYQDRALALPPLTTTLARRLIERTRISEALGGVRGRAPVDVPALEQLLVRFSQLVVEQRSIKEVDINPVLASPGRLLALDARIVLHPPGLSEEELPQLAIHPYPGRYQGVWKMKSGETVRVRPIRPEDEEKLVRLHGMLSSDSVYLRYASRMSLAQRTAHERLARLCFIDYTREMALVAESDHEDPARRDVIAIGRLLRLHGTQDAEFGMLVADPYQHQGLGTELLRRLLEVGRDWKLEHVIADILPQNKSMQAGCRALGFDVFPGETVRAVKKL